MPYINYNGQTIEITEAELELFNQGKYPAPAAGGELLQLNNTQKIINPNTSVNLPNVSLTSVTQTVNNLASTTQNITNTALGTGALGASAANTVNLVKNTAAQAQALATNVTNIASNVTNLASNVTAQADAALTNATNLANNAAANIQNLANNVTAQADAALSKLTGLADSGVNLVTSAFASAEASLASATATATDLAGSFSLPSFNAEEDPFEAARLAAIAAEEEENAINLSALDVPEDVPEDTELVDNPFPEDIPNNPVNDSVLEPTVENPFADDVEPEGAQNLDEEDFTDLAEPVDPDADPELLSDNPDDEVYVDLAEPVDPDADPELLGGPGEEEDGGFTELAEPVDPDAPELLGGPADEEEGLVQLSGPSDVDETTLEGYGVAETGATGAVGGLVSGAIPANPFAAQQNATILKAKEQATLQARYKQPASSDWRVRLQLAPQANYLYKAKPPGILAPLYNTDGVIFPYTPSIETSYTASYDRADLVHSNYRGYFYKNSAVGDINIRGIFTAQDTQEADYLLAVIHFFRSVTKMFYGQDTQRGAPPPLVYLSGLGQYQFNQHPCVVSSFTYSLPTDVDYIRAGAPNNYGTNLLAERAKTNGGQSSNAVSAVLSRLTSANLNTSNPTLNVPIVNQLTQNVNNLNQATYVPTKIEISIQLLPINTRSQISQQFSVKDFAAGNLIKGGFW